MTASLQVKNDRYYAVISYKDGEENKQKWIALGMPVKNNKRKDEAKLEEIKRKFEEQYSTPAGDILFIEYINQWLRKKKPLVQTSTWEGYEVYVTRHIVPYFAPLKLSMRELRPGHIKDYYEFS
jgi:hypothetical protein